MRGEIDPQQSMFSYVDIEKRIPASHPIRKIRTVIDTAIVAIEADIDEQYSSIGRPSIPPEQLLGALYLQIFYSVRSERLLVDRIEYDLLFRWFVGLGIDDSVWSHSTFSKNRDRVLTEHIAQRLFDEVKRQAYAKQLMSRDHFSVDGTLMDACASMKSLFCTRPAGFTTGYTFSASFESEGVSSQTGSVSCMNIILSLCFQYLIVIIDSQLFVDITVDINFRNNLYISVS